MEFVLSGDKDGQLDQKELERFGRTISVEDINTLSSIISGNFPDVEVKVPGQHLKDLGVLKSVNLSIADNNDKGISLIFAKKNDPTSEETFIFNDAFRPQKPRMENLSEVVIRTKTKSDRITVIGYSLIIINDPVSDTVTTFSFSK